MTNQYQCDRCKKTIVRDEKGILVYGFWFECPRCEEVTELCEDCVPKRVKNDTQSDEVGKDIKV